MSDEKEREGGPLKHNCNIGKPGEVCGCRLCMSSACMECIRVLTSPRTRMRLSRAATLGQHAFVVLFAPLYRLLHQSNTAIGWVICSLVALILLMDLEIVTIRSWGIALCWFAAASYAGFVIYHWVTFLVMQKIANRNEPLR